MTSESETMQPDSQYNNHTDTEVNAGDAQGVKVDQPEVVQTDQAAQDNQADKGSVSEANQTAKAEVIIEDTASNEDDADKASQKPVSLTPLSADSPTVVYELPVLAERLDAPILVVGYGSPMKNTVKTAVKCGFSKVWVTGTDDKVRGFSCSGAAQVASIGAKFDARLFTNEYAVLGAIKQSAAKILLVCDSEFANRPLLRMVAYQAGAQVLTPMNNDRTHLIWAECAPDPSFGDREVTWRQCPKCKLYHDEKPVLASGGVCPTCGELHRLNSTERLNYMFDADSFEEWNTGIPETDPLDFPGYLGKLAKQRERSGFEEAVRTGRAKLNGRKVAVGVMETTFMMGSMGLVVGEKITRLVERATAEHLPLIIFTASGGARMQEGLVSLMQMGKISAAVERHSRAGLLYISVITDPTTGGVTASFATQGDIIVSEPHALIGFAGRRVIQDTIRQTLPEGFQTAEFALEHGLIDAIVERAKMREFLSSVVEIHCIGQDVVEGKQIVGAGASEIEPAMASVNLEKASESAPTKATGNPFARLFQAAGAALSGDRAFPLKHALKKRGIADVPSIPPAKTDNKDTNPAWESVQLARNVHRPTSLYYINHMVDGFIELHGDRAFADDGAIVGGIGWIDGVPVTVIAEEKGADLQQRIKRNFGCPEPEGYRKSLRLMRQAEKFGRPIVCLVDTQGAFCDMDAEERGQGNAIADNLFAMSGFGVPVICVVLGEGGSGGALALAMGNRVAMQEHAVYSVLSPEGFASILWKDRSRAAEAAAVMKMSAAEACELGLIEEVLSEGEKPAHENPDQAVVAVHDFISRSLEELLAMTPDELREQRYERFRAF